MAEIAETFDEGALIARAKAGDDTANGQEIIRNDVLQCRKKGKGGDGTEQGREYHGENR